MGITSSNKTVNVTTIPCGGSLNVRLSLTATPDILENPVDVVLLLDRSGSMEGSPLSSMKAGADTFIDILAEATGGSAEGQIGAGSRIGVVSFATVATADTALITDVAQLKDAVSDLTAGGNTNHAAAFTQAVELFDAASTNQKVIVLFTDGRTTQGGDATPIATMAKAMGITIYVIGLEGNGGIDLPALVSWASEPASAYVAIAPTEAELEDLFEDLARNITKPGATNITLTDTVNDCFQITGLQSPTKGSASLQGTNRVVWNIAELGTTGNEGASLEFTITHTGDCSGLVEVNESVDYDDAEGNMVDFPSPTVTVDCGVIVVPEPCPEAIDIPVSGCEELVEFDAGDLELSAQGRIVELAVTLERVCPGRRVALAAILTEVDACGEEHQRGMKIFTIPAHTGTQCRDVSVRCIRFVLPELSDDPMACGCTCRDKTLRARFLANYVDSGFFCSCGQPVTLQP